MRTIPSADIGVTLDGYMSNIAFTDDAAHSVGRVCDTIAQKIPGVAWFQPKESLHVTLFDFIAPKVDYGIDHKTMFEQQENNIKHVITQLALEAHHFTITLNTIRVGQAAIYLQGSDDGSIEHMRNHFMELYELDEKTKIPPKIIHSTIARFIDSVDVKEVEHVISQLDVNVKISVDCLRLVHEQQLPMLRYRELYRRSIS